MQNSLKAECAFFRVLTGCILGDWVLSVPVWEVFLCNPEQQQAASEVVRCALQPIGCLQGLVYGDPALLRLLLPVSLAFCSSFVFPARGVGQSHEEEPAPLFGCWSLGWVFGRREFCIVGEAWIPLLRESGRSISVPWRFSPGEIGLGFLVRGSG